MGRKCQKKCPAGRRTFPHPTGGRRINKTDLKKLRPPQAVASMEGTHDSNAQDNTTSFSEELCSRWAENSANFSVSIQINSK